MRLLQVRTENIGGVVDGNLTLPDGPIAALAGGNGTGKSKILACLIAPWTGMIPAAKAGTDSLCVLTVQFSESERRQMDVDSQAMGWGQAPVPEFAQLIFSQNPAAGFRRGSLPRMTILENFQAVPHLFEVCPSLNVVYLPAERRLLESNVAGIDLNQLSDAIRQQKTAEPRSSVQNYGRLDDQEFETFAKALCVAATLPDEPGAEGDSARNASERWNSFARTVNELIYPKVLVPLTRQNPDRLRIRTVAGDMHSVADLSSGERQALVIISRVLRAGVGHSLVIIDEPDAYLHPQLSTRLIRALQEGVGQDGQLIVATHSPGILDDLPPSSIVRMSHSEPARILETEEKRLELYREAGFRASSLTQSDLLLVVEGESDVDLLRLVVPDLARATVKSAGGRAQVLREVSLLAPHDLPVLGVVDRDVWTEPPAEEIADRIIVWHAADIEGVFLGDPEVLQEMLARGLIKASFSSLRDLQALLSGLMEEQRDNVIAETAQKILRSQIHPAWPSPRGGNAIERLRRMVSEYASPAPDTFESALGEARQIWDDHEGDSRWYLVRGKYVLNQFASEASHMQGRPLLEAIARVGLPHGGLDVLREKVAAALD